MKQKIGFLALVCILPCFAFAAADTQTLSVNAIKKTVETEQIAKEAYLWGYPLVRFERTRRLMTTTPGYGHAAMNYFFHANRLPSSDDTGVANPIPDTLYSSAWLDLREQPLVLEIPKIKDRYYSLQFFDGFNGNIGVISSRTRGATPGKFFITGPHYIGPTPSGFEAIHSTTNFVWLNGRIEATNPSQVKSSYKLISKYQLKPYSVYLGKERMAKKPPKLLGKADVTRDPRRIASSGLTFFDELGMALRENDPTGLNMTALEHFRSADIGTGLITSRHSNNREEREAYARAIVSAEMDIEKAVHSDLIVKRNGWNFVLPKGDVKSDYTLRAAMSRVYFGQSLPQESLHPVTYTDTSNTRLNGNASYILRFGKNRLPPVGALWSVVAYNAREKSLISNSLNRYSVGSYSQSFATNPDGSIDIYVSSTEPRGFTQNWLPVPRGDFYLMVNMYNPTNDVIQGKYTLPEPQRINLTPVISFNN